MKSACHTFSTFEDMLSSITWVFGPDLSRESATYVHERQDELEWQHCAQTQGAAGAFVVTATFSTSFSFMSSTSSQPLELVEFTRTSNAQYIQRIIGGQCPLNIPQEVKACI
eukprot:1788692-Pleurochrysis_carterae.AAC.1